VIGIPRSTTAVLTMWAAMWAGGAIDRTVAAPCSPYDPTPTVIEHAAVVTMEDETVHEPFTVVVDGGRIAWTGPDGEAASHRPASARVIDATGRTVVPGLADMHVHMDLADADLYLAYGVTEIREMNGSPEHLKLRDRICSGEVVGPTMSVTGPLLAGVPQRYRHELVETPEAAARIVAAEAAAGFEAVKAYDGLREPVYAALVAAAAAAGLPVYGHIPEDVGLDGVLAAHQRSIEHADQLINAIGSHDKPADADTMAATARRIRDAGSWFTPTLAVEYGLSRAGATSYADDLKRPEMKFIDDGTRGWWASLAKGRTGGDPTPGEFPTDRAREYFARKQELVRACDRAGVSMLAGTDTPNPLMIPGYSLVDEILTLHAAGLSSFRSLAMATREAALFLRQPREFGVIAAGGRADLLIVRGNPLADPNALRALEGVMARGRWFPKGTLPRNR
jgi:imidazolonepropionase-like amidohydrolase